MPRQKKTIKKETKTSALKSAPKTAAKKPAPVTSKPKPVAPAPTEQPTERYWEAVGRRKTAVARVRIFTRGDKGLWINQKPTAEYFTYPRFSQTATEALSKMKSLDRFHVLAKVSGGGPNAQSQAVRHGTARALVLFNADFRKRLKRAGFLTRDPRMKERKKFGLKRARRAPQWAKR